MIFKLTLEHGTIEYATALDKEDLLVQYAKEIGQEAADEIEEVEEISEEAAKDIWLVNGEYNEDDPNFYMPEKIQLWALAAGTTDFMIVGGTDY